MRFLRRGYTLRYAPIFRVEDGPTRTRANGKPYVVTQAMVFLEEDQDTADDQPTYAVALYGEHSDGRTFLAEHVVHGRMGHDLREFIQPAADLAVADFRRMVAARRAT